MYVCMRERARQRDREVEREKERKTLAPTNRIHNCKTGHTHMHICDQPAKKVRYDSWAFERPEEEKEEEERCVCVWGGRGRG